MAKYFEVNVVVNHEVDNGKKGVKIQKVRETYLVDSESVTEAESKVVKLFEDANIELDFEVKGAKESKILQVVQ